MKLVLVKWRDSQSFTDTVWFQRSDIKGKPGLIHSVGYVVEQSNDHIVLIADWDRQHDDQLGRHITIPRGCIKEIVCLKPVK